MESTSTVDAYLLHTVPDLLCNQQESHALFHPQTPALHEEKPADMLPNSAFGFAHPLNCAAQHKNLSYVLSHGLSKDPKPLLPHGQILKERCVEQRMATLTRNGSANEVVCANSNMDMAQSLHKLGSFMHNVGLAVDPSKGGLSIHQDMHVQAPSMDPKFAKSSVNRSCLSKQASFTTSSQLAQVAANPQLGGHVGGKLDSTSSGLRKARSQENLPNGLHTVDKTVCTGANIANGCRIGLQATVKQTVTMSPKARAISKIKEEPTSIMDKSEESFGQAAASPCETTTTERFNKGKNKRVKDLSKDAAAQNTETDEVKKGKRYKSGGDTSEEDQKVGSGDSTPLTGKGSSKLPEPSKLDYIHVRARRGQATDSHSLAERVRREKLSERMKFLQDLVPGCSKVAGKALMLDEIINYVQSLQQQVEFLSMKLASVNPILDFYMDGLFGKTIRPQATEHKVLMMCDESPTSYSPYLHFSQHAHVPQQMVSPCPLVNAHSLGGSDMVGRQTMSTALASMDYYGDAISQQLTQAWEEELQQVLQGRPAPFTSSNLQGQPFFNAKKKIEL